MANYTSQFSGQHNDNYDERISALESNIISLQDTITSLQSTVTAQQSIITTLSNKIVTLEGKETYNILWAGSWSGQGAQITLNDSIMNYKKIQLVINDIPSRSPVCDVPMVTYYTEIQSHTSWDFSNWAMSLLGTIVRKSNTVLELSYWKYTGPYQSAIVKVVGFKTY